jgi:DNA-binding NarL/FixJ family response regulator
MSGTISVFLADDNLIVREGVRALLSLETDLEIVGAAADYDSLVNGAAELAPQVVVTDIRMPPSFQHEGIAAAHEIRKRHPGTGVVILSQFDDPEYAISLLADGSAGYAYLLKDRIAEGDQLARAVRAVATGGSVLDASIVEAMVHPVTDAGDLTTAEEELLRLVAEGRPIKAIAAALGTTAAATSDDVEKLFLRIAQQASTGGQNSLRRLRLLHQAIVNREEQGESLSRLLPGGRRRDRRNRRACRERSHVRHQGLFDHRRADRPECPRPSAEHAPGRDEPGDPRLQRDRHAVRRGRRHGRLRRTRPDGRPRRPGGHGRPRHA